MIKNWEPLKKDDSKTAFQAGPVYFYQAKAGAVLADHTHEQAETLWIISRSGQIQIAEDTEDFKAPCIIEISANTYHKFTAQTDVEFIEQRGE